METAVRQECAALKGGGETKDAEGDVAMQEEEQDTAQSAGSRNERGNTNESEPRQQPQQEEI
eukprot:12039960-Karenia_brevis.AAC.1